MLETHVYQCQILKSFLSLNKMEKNLKSEEYAACLISYFDDSKSLSKVTLPDLNNVLGGMQRLMFGSMPISRHTVLLKTGDTSFNLIQALDNLSTS